MALSLTDKIVQLHRSFDAAGLPHAFGGALALAFCTREPRATHDIDVNVFVGTERVAEVVAAQPTGVARDETARRLLGRDGQARLWWEETPVDIFLSNHPFHADAEVRYRRVPFADVEDLPVLDCTDLAVFKAFFARPKDAVDIAAMAQAGTLDTDRLVTTIADLLGPDSSHADFLRWALTLGQPPA